MFEKQRGRGGTPHIPFEGIWSDVQTKVGTPHQVGAARLRSRVGGRLVKSDFRSHSGSYQISAWIQDPSQSRVWQSLGVKELWSMVEGIV